MTPLSHLLCVQCEQVKFRLEKKVEIKVSHNVVTVGTVGAGRHRIFGVASGAYPSPFAVLCFPDSKQVPIYFWAFIR